MSHPLRPGPAALFVGFLAALLPAMPLRGADEPSAADLEHFETRVRPLLAERCQECHSRAAGKQKGGLYLDHRDDLLRGGDTRPAIVPGDPAASLLVEAVRYGNPDLQMPPRTRLTGAEVAVLEEWIRRGAPWPGGGAAAGPAGGFDLAARRDAHWCWRPPVAVEPPPEVSDDPEATEPAGAVDRFLLAALRARGLRPAAPADPATWLRRVTFDLTGLPPTPAEIDAFLADRSAGAGERVVDRLLASPHFGERWARHWLDLVRWAETRGHEFDPDIPNAWRYRDYVIRAFNDDLPHDRFVREHIAGDLLPPRVHPATGANESLLATGFWFLGEELHSPVDIRQDEMDRIDNRLDVMGKAFLGLTLGCARCHDHKFDAVSQRDYYALAGILVGSGYRQVRYETLDREVAVAAELEEWRSGRARAVLQAYGRAVLPGLEQAAERMLAALPGGTAPDDDPWRAVLGRAARDPLDPWREIAAVADPASGAVATPPGARVLAFDPPGGAAWRQDGASFGTRARRPGEALWSGDPRRPLSGIAPWAGLWRDPAWPDPEQVDSAGDAGRLGGWVRSGQMVRTADFELAGGRLWYLVRGAGRAYAVVNSHLMVNGPLHGALLREWKAPEGGWDWIPHDLADYPGHRLHVEFSPAGGRDFAVAAVVQAEARPPWPAEADPDSGTGAGAGGPADRTARAREIGDHLVRVARGLAGEGVVPDGRGDAARADWLVRHLDLLAPEGSPARREFEAAVADAARDHAAILGRVPRGSRTAPAMLDGPGIDGRVLKRGSPRLPGEEVPRRFLEAVDGPDAEPFREGSGRLGLAGRMTAPDNPLTARVAVNRVWHHLFGRGLVATPDNLGVLGEPPSHPELLDHLAWRFRTEMGGSTKRLIRELVLTRAYRMSSVPADPVAESVDPGNVLLHRMNLRRLEAEAIRDAMLAVSGRLDPAVGGPSVPVHLTPFMEGRGRPDRSGPMDGAGRRSLYLELRRNFLPPMLLAYDLPIPFNAVGRRNVSNVPAQALTLMNDPFVVEMARLWASRLPPGLPPPERVTRMYREAFGRVPDPAELQAATEFVESQASRRRAVGDSPGLAWADLAHVLFNVKEFIHRN